MPKLPDFTDLGGVAPSAPRSFVAIPGADFSGARAMAQGLGQVGASIENIQKDREEKARKQERFNTKMGLLKAEEAYADRVKDLDPLDPAYVEKKKQYRKETIGPVLEGVQDPENRQMFEAATYEDFVNIGVTAEKEQRTAFGKKAEIDVGTYTDGLRKKIRSGTYTGDAREELRQTIEDNQFLNQLEKEALFSELGDSLDADVLETDFENLSTNGVSVTPEVQAAISAAAGGEGVPPWMAGYLGRVATLESSGGRKVINPDNPDVAGVWQFASVTGKEFGLNSVEDRLDVPRSTEAVVELSMRNFSQLQEALGREPTQGELYLAHQQGATGAIKLLTDPEAKAVDVLGKKAVEMNLPESLKGKAGSITAAEFAGLWSGKFERKGGTIDEDEVMGVLEQSPSYMRLGPDAQDKVKKNLLTRIETQNKEAEKAAKIQVSRDTVDYAVANFEDRNEAEAFIKKTIADPDTREDALTMMTTQYNRIDENRKAAEKEKINSAYDAVSSAMDAGDPSAALAAIPADIPGEDKAKLRKLVTDGRASTDDPDTYNGILAMKLGTPEERAKFASLDLRPYIGVLKPSTIEALAKDQEAIKKQVADTGKVVSLETPAAMLDQRLRELEIDVSTKASTADLRVAREIRAIMAQNLDTAVKQKGSDLTPTEIETVMDRTFMQFRGKTPGWFSSSDATFTLKDVTDKYTDEEQRLELTDGALLDEALADFRSQGIDVTPARLDKWLKLKMDGAAK